MTIELKNFIAGTWVESKTTFAKTSPFDGSHVATVHEATEQMVDDAVTAGRAVSIGKRSTEWGDLPQGPQARNHRGFCSQTDGSRG